MIAKSLFRSLIVLCVASTPALLAFQASQAPPGVQRHPLDPLSADEINAAAKVLRASPDCPSDALFATIVLKEPAKSDVLRYTAGTTIARQAFAVLLDRRRNRTFEAVVDLNTSRLVTWIEVKGVQPVVLEAEYDTFVNVVKGDARWQQAMRQRGIDEFDDVQVDFWAVGQVAPRYQTRRLLRAVSYFKGNGANFYSRPIEGVGVLVDMNAERVVEFIDTGTVPLPRDPGA